MLRAHLLPALVGALRVILLPAQGAGVTAQEAQPLVDVALDPGHSYQDVGAVGGGLHEYELSLDVALRAKNELEAAGRTVRLTRTDTSPLTPLLNPSDTDQIRLEQEARINAAAPARVFVSLHFNGGPKRLRGTETYYNPDRGGDGSSDRRLAGLVQQNVLTSLANYGYASADRGAKSDLLAGKPYGHFFSLRGPMTSVLAELLFLSNPTEAALLQLDEARDAMAHGVAQGILEYLLEADGLAPSSA